LTATIQLTNTDHYRRHGGRGGKGWQLPPPNRPWTRYWDSRKSNEICNYRRDDTRNCI